MLPITVNLKHKKVLVVGGGLVAQRRIAKLLHENADVHVVAPTLCPNIRSWARNGKVRWTPREFQPTDTKNTWLCYAHTDSPCTNQEIARLCAQEQIFCLAGGSAQASDFWMMATTTTNTGLTVATSANKNPQRSKTAVHAIARFAQKENL
ncbi:NAD(P)-dependent oxidoreductase [uncultured Rothia sp.]|uniref:precorrin-2 dehydrogenase/sirohydrochlorin ferrochelatase family protein n=1 Tax=uncultured Rothia sp. TaxID=316088 RepID=UPI0032172B72